MGVQDGMYGNPIQSLGTNGFWGTPVDRFIKYIPICSPDGGSYCARRPAGSRIARKAWRDTPELKAAGVTDPEAEMRMSPSIPFLKYPEQLDGWVGGEKGFDPLNTTDAIPVYFMREAELKHGRVCMLATIGWIATDLGVRFPGELFQNVTTVQAHDKMVEAGIMGPFLATIGVVELYSYFLITRGYDGEIKRDAGDYFLGKNFLPKDPEQERLMRLKELENGRLAMIAFGGICTQAVLTGKTWPFF